MDTEALHAHVEALKKALNNQIFGQEDLILEALCAFLAHGHILITGAPGLAKTTLVKAFAEQLGLVFGRVQFTPDLLPSDITGGEILNMDPETQKRFFEFTQGPIFVNLLLADEINRASPRTQSSMLEAMQERNVSINGTSYALPDPFMVFATQNPYESEGTFPLPEAQLDRFLVHSLVHYPAQEHELTILKTHSKNQLAGEVRKKEVQKPILSQEIILKMMEAIQKIQITDELLGVINEIVRMSRPSDSSCLEKFKSSIWFGAGPRGGISLVSAAKALAFLDKKEEVRFQHIERMAKPVLRHRIKLSPMSQKDRITSDDVIGEILENIKAKYSKII